MNLREHFLQILLQEEIDNLLTEATQRREGVRADEHAKRLSQKFPRIRMSPLNLADEIAAAAAYAGVPVEESRQQI